jgi:hypothetical protein
MKLITSVIQTVTKDIPLKDSPDHTWTIGNVVDDEIANMLYLKDNPNHEPGIDKVDGIKSICLEFDETDSDHLIKQVNL